MTIYFHTRRLQRTCSRQAEAVRLLGPKRARKLQQRLMELAAAATLADISRLPPARCHELAGDRKGQLSVDLEHPYRLLFIPANDPIPHTTESGLDWERVTEIEVIAIVDTH
jgi:plasmid maintenance system killer protein